MVRKSRARASSLFLMELILAILFFSAASAICVQFFVRSHLLSRNSDALSHAVIECSSAAETVSASDSIQEIVSLLRELYPEGCYPTVDELAGTEESNVANDPAENISPVNITAAEIMIYYDNTFLPCGEEGSAYMLILQLTQESGMLNANIQMHTHAPEKESGQEETIYELDIQHHIAGRTGYEKR